MGSDTSTPMSFLAMFDFSFSNFAGTNQLACDCNVYNSLVAVIDSLASSRAAVCRTPSQVAGARFYPGGSYETFYRQRFLCSK